MRLIRVILVLAACAGLIWFSVRTAALNALLSKSPAAAAIVAPEDPRVVMGIAMAEFSETGGRVRAELQEASMRSLARAPLEDEPFLLASVSALAREDEAGDRLIVEAARRNPRSRITQLLLLDRQLRAGSIAEAVTTINLLSRLIPDAQTVLIGQLVEFARNPSTRQAVVRVLERDPTMKSRVLDYLAADAKDLDLILALAGAGDQRGDGSSPPAWQQKLLAALAARGDVQRAYQLWSRFSEVGIGKPTAGIYDPTFAGLPGLPPFNWQFIESNGGVAERSGSSGLQVQYYGRGDARLVEQMLVLPPGRYRFSSKVEGSVPPESGRLAWQLSCHKSGSTPLDLSLTSGGDTQRVVSSEFTIPSGCASQWLALVGAPAEFSKEVNLTIPEVTLEKVG